MMVTDLNASIRPFILQDLWLAELTRLADTRSADWARKVGVTLDSQFLTGESG